MSKKNIGIVFSISRKMGVFQYGLSIAESLINFCDDFDYTIFYYGKENPKEFFKIDNPEKLSRASFISLDPVYNNIFGKIKLFLNILIGKPVFMINKTNRQILKDSKIDLLIIPFPLLFGFENKIPYIVSIPDVMFKYYPGFPEYPLKSRIVLNFVFKCVMEHSLLNVVDSNFGANDLKKFFNVPEEKIKAIPYIPPGYVFKYKDMAEKEADEVILKYNLPEKFIFYPAQFWFHKNHLRLVKALAIIKEKKNEKVNLVLAGDPGANFDNYKKTMDLAKELGVDLQIFALGYVPDKTMIALYKKSYSLVFPTLIGPTSIPPLEAMVLGTAVLCSNLFAMPEQIGDAGILFDPFNPDDMAEKIWQLWANPGLREKLVLNGQKTAEKNTKQEFARQWEDSIKKACKQLFCAEGWPLG